MNASDPPPKNHSEDTRNHDERYDCDGDHLNHDHGNVMSTHTNSDDFLVLMLLFFHRHHYHLMIGWTHRYRHMFHWLT